MLHEALLYLWGCPGKFCNSNAGEEWLDSIQLQNFLHPGEKKLFLRIIDITIDYYNIQEFIKTILTRSDFKADANDVPITFEAFQKNDFTEVEGNILTIYKEKRENQNSFEFTSNEQYLKAFCNGLDTALEDYRNEIIELERKILQNLNLSLTYVYSYVSKYETLFKAIKSMIRTIKMEKLRGCILMGRILTYYNSGVSEVIDASLKILSSMNVVFYRQLSNWIIFGELVDIYHEFFICDGECDDEDFLCALPSQEKISDTSLFSASVNLQQIRKPPKVHKFYLKQDMIPSNITLELVQVILFMGRMVWIIRNDPTNSQDDEFQLKVKRDIWNGKELQYFQKFHELEDRPFNIIEFSEPIEECRLCITKYVWSVMVEEAKLFEHLQLIRDYYALGKGELFQQFIINLQEKVKTVPKENLCYNMNKIFDDISVNLYTDNDQTHKRFKLYFPPDSESFLNNHWLNIEMNFEIIWPLHIIFHPGAIKLYNKLFKFLLRIKKIQINLEMIWMTHMKTKFGIHQNAWVLRNNLMFLISNILYYLQVDVIDVQFTLLIKSVITAANVEDFIKLHAEFLGNLMSGTFLMVMNDDMLQRDYNTALYKLPSLDYKTVNRNNVFESLVLLLDLCDDFIEKSSICNLNQDFIEEIEDLQQKCDFIVENLLKTLFSLRRNRSGNHLLQLFHRIDFNRWFSKNLECMEL